MANNDKEKKPVDGTDPVVRMPIMTRAEIAESFGIPPQAVLAIESPEFGTECVAILPDGERLYSFERYYDFMRDFAKGYFSLA